ncbi:MAG: ketopantoate reductase family protein [Candidatus Hodarchaeales archaeon]|jgi:2-dehydropantoate 2-reductase
MRVAVIGIGAVGGPVAAHLAENNVDVTAVTKHADLAELIRTKGLKLQGKEKVRSVAINAVPLITDLEGKYDIIFLAMKATSLIKAAKEVIPLLYEDSAVVTLQNGVVEDEVAKIVGKERVIGAAVIWAATIVKPGVIERTADGMFYIGLIDEKGNQKRLEEVAKLLECCQPAKMTDNIYGALYTKLAINATINGLGAISGLTIGKLVESSRTRLLFMGIVTELIAIARGLGIQLIKTGAFHPQDIAITGSDTPASMEKKHQILMEIFGPHVKVKASTLQSLERGEKSEIDYLNGYIAMKGRELTIPTPINTKITQMVKEIEIRKRIFTPDNLLELPPP